MFRLSRCRLPLLGAFAAAMPLALAAPVAQPTATNPANGPTDDTMLTNADIFTEERYEAEQPGRIRWLDGAGYTMLVAVEDGDGDDAADAGNEQDGSGGGAGGATTGEGVPAPAAPAGEGDGSAEAPPTPKQIVRFDPATGEQHVLVSAEALTPEGADAPLVVDDYVWSEDRTRLLIYTNSQKVWRQKTRGDYWVLHLPSGSLRRLGGIADPASLQFAKFSPDGNRVAWARDANVYVEHLETGEILQLTERPHDAVINGITSWAYEEEFGIRDGFRWSPDGQHIAYWQFDTSGVRDFVLIDNTSDTYPRLTRIPYPKVGETISAARIGVVGAGGGDTVWMALPGDPRNGYVPRMGWAGERSDAVLIQHVNRRQNLNTLYLGDVATGETRAIFVDEEAQHLDGFHDVEWLDDGAAFTFMSERSGWRHVLRVAADGEEVRDLTPGDFDVTDLVAVDEQTGVLYFIASPDDATQRYLFRSRLDGTGTPERLTPAAFAGTNEYDISGDGRWAVHTHSSFMQPPQYRLISLPQHETVEVLEDNQALIDRLATLNLGGHEFFRVEARDGLALDGFLMTPPDFDDARQYPIIFYVYGEVAGSTVRDRWGGQRHLWHLLMTQRGYLVASIDNRGTRTPRGRAWRKSVYGGIGILASRDQADALGAMLDRYPFIDEQRVGIWGHSGGGSMTLNMLFRYPGQYHVGVSRAPVADQRLYDAIYQERYSGLLEDYADAYVEASPITHAKHLQGRLLLVHGTGDDNVHYQNSERLIDELVKHDRRFDFLAYPNRDHRIDAPKGTSRHLYGTMTDYFDEHLKARAPTPADEGATSAAARVPAL